MPDGSALLLWRDEGGKATMVRLALTGAQANSARPQPLLPSAFSEFAPRISPDGRLLAYTSVEPGKPQTYLVELHLDGSVGRPIQLGTQGGGGLRLGEMQQWAHDGKTLYVQDERNRVMKVAVTSTPRLSVSAPVEAFDADRLGVQLWTVLPDGRFLVGLKNDNEGEINHYNLVLDWTTELTRRMRGTP
jgi:hypothetical protein